MKKSLLATSLICSLGLSAGAYAYNLQVDGSSVSDITIESWSFTDGTLTLNSSAGNAKLAIDGTTEEPTTEEPTTEEPTTEEPTTEEPTTDGGCENAPSDVVCTEPFDWIAGESHTAFSIPQGKTLSTPFTTTSGTDFRGKISFEARSDTMPQTNVWVSKTPGGSALTSGSIYNSFYCTQEQVSFSYSLRWYQYDSTRGCVLEPNTQYYLNLRHESDSYPTSYAYRWRSNNGEAH